MSSDETHDDQQVVHLDSRQIRTLAHPLRARLLGQLRTDGPATATTLAKALGTNTGATSYHLRQLAEVGLVTEDPDRSTGRQRFWRSAHVMSSFRSTDFDGDPDASAASDWVQRLQVNFLSEYAERWIAAQHDHSPEWRETAGFSDYLLRISAARLEALHQELWQVIERYRDESSPDEPDAEPVMLFLAGFPRLEAPR